MYTYDEIMKFVYLVAEVSDPDRIILFGSYAYGDPNEKSDLDLLVIKNDNDISIEDETKLAVAIYDARKKQQIKTKYDVFFSTDSQVKKTVENGGAFVDALQKGKVVYERAYQ